MTHRPAGWTIILAMMNCERAQGVLLSLTSFRISRAMLLIVLNFCRHKQTCHASPKLRPEHNYPPFNFVLGFVGHTATLSRLSAMLPAPCHLQLQLCEIFDQ